jgi:hypothetical protein
VKYFVMFLIVLGVFSVGGSSNVANLAHLGGALAGLIYILIERRQRFGKGPLDNLRERMNFSSSSKQTEDVVDATVYDIHTKEQRPNVQSGNELQKNIDEILDKINKSGYQSLTAEEKKILFEASKRMN